MLKEVQRDRGLTVLLLVSAGLLVYLVVRDFGSGMPDEPRLSTGVAPPLAVLPTREFAGLFGAVSTQRVAAASGGFHTTHFQPPPKPSPPAPTTRTVEATYLGYFEAGGRPRRAIVRLGEAQAIIPAGSNLVADVFVSGIAMRTLTLTNAAGATNVLAFDVKTNLVVPIQ
jgi:hypothetical protein